MEQNLGTLNKELEDIALQLENIFLDPNNPRFISKNWNDISDEHISDDMGISGIKAYYRDSGMACI